VQHKVLRPGNSPIRILFAKEPTSIPELAEMNAQNAENRLNKLIETLKTHENAVQIAHAINNAPALKGHQLGTILLSSARRGNADSRNILKARFGVENDQLDALILVIATRLNSANLIQ
jgi:soluble P-type ATPase